MMKLIIAAMALFTPAQAFSEEVAVDDRVLTSEAVVPLCRAVMDETIRTGDAKAAVEKLDRAMVAQGMGNGTRAAVFAICTAYGQGRLDGVKAVGVAA